MTNLLRLLAASLFLFASTLLLTPVGAQAAAASRDTYDCDDFDHDDRNYWIGAKGVYINAGGPLKDPYGLDGDLDGYPCEDLAKKTAAPGEPSCTVRCARRSAYRMLFWLTGPTRGDLSTEAGRMAFARSVEATRANAMALFAPTVKANETWGPYLNDFVKMAYYDVSSSGYAQAVKCTNSVRTALRNAVRNESIISYAGANRWESGYDHSQSIMKKIMEKLADRVLRGTLYSSYVPKYIEVAVQVGQAAIEQQLQENQRMYLFNQVVEGC